MQNVSSRCGNRDSAPRLRFPEFNGEWVEKKLGEISERVTRKNKNNETDLPLTISSKDGLVDQITYFNKTVASKDMSGYYLLKNGEFAYNKSYSVGYDFGSVKRLDKYPMGALSTLYICFSIKNFDSDFMKVYFDSLKWYREIYLIAAEGARNHGLLNISTEDFFETRHKLPLDIPEQKKIAAFFTLLDRRIQKQRQLVERLKTYKRGVFSVLLNTFSKYETLLLENCASIKKGEQLNKTDMIKNGKYYVLNGGVAASGRTDNFNTDKNTISISEGGNSCGFVLFNTEKFWSGGHCYTLQNLKQNINNQYLFHYLKFHEKQIMSLRVGSGLPNIQKSELEKFEVLLPSADIQNKIANIMSNITAYENVVKKELLNFNKLKLALLQKMFI